jgi:hypothetical protein
VKGITLVITTRLGIGINAVIIGIITTFIRAVGTVEGIEHVVERSTFDEVADLVERDGLNGAQETHGILEIEIGFAVVVETCVSGLDDASVDGSELGPRTDEIGFVDSAEKIEVGRYVCLRRVFDDSKRVLGRRSKLVRDVIEGSQAIQSDLLITVGGV